MTFRYEIEANYVWMVDGKAEKKIDGDELKGILYHYSEKDDLTDEQIITAVSKSAFDEEGTIFINITKLHHVSISGGWETEAKLK